MAPARMDPPPDDRAARPAEGLARDLASPHDGRVAVALHYEAGKGRPPKVVASGRGELAETILALAFAHDVKVREDADLAEMLAAVEVGEDIPIEAFVAVAEVLSYVYAANREQMSREPAR